MYILFDTMSKQYFAAKKLVSFIQLQDAKEAGLVLQLQDADDANISLKSYARPDTTRRRTQWLDPP